MRLTILAALAAFCLYGQQVAAKPEAPPKVEKKETPPVLPSTAKLWRLNSKAVSARQAANETPQAKAAVSAEADLQAEYNRMAAICGPNFVLGFDQDQNSPTFEDLICMQKPPEPKPEAAKGK